MNRKIQIRIAGIAFIAIVILLSTFFGIIQKIKYTICQVSLNPVDFRC